MNVLKMLVRQWSRREKEIAVTQRVRINAGTNSLSEGEGMGP